MNVAFQRYLLSISTGTSSQNPRSIGVARNFARCTLFFLKADVFFSCRPQYTGYGTKLIKLIITYTLPYHPVPGNLIPDADFY